MDQSIELDEVETIMRDSKLVAECVCGLHGEIPARLLQLAVEHVQGRLENMRVSSPCKTAMLGFDPPQRV